ncbi:MAG: hypothetical protein Fur0018_24770 [Anaerolineales bacterium]
MTSIRKALQALLAPPAVPPPGIYTRNALPDETPAYRLHLRLEPDESGTLIVNAATVLHLNPTAAACAYHFIHHHTPTEAAADLTRRYRVSRAQVIRDYAQFQAQLRTLLQTPDLAPDIYLESQNISHSLTAPLRLDCALTFRQAETPSEDAPGAQAHAELSTAEWCTILERAWQAGIPHVIFTGGEPTLRADLPDLIAHTEAIGMVSGLCSQGQRLSDPVYRHTLLQTGLDHLIFLLQPENPVSWQALEAILPEDLYTTVHLTLSPENAPQAAGHLHKLAGLHPNALSLSASAPALYAALQTLQTLAADLELELKWGLPVPYGAANPIALEQTTEETVEQAAPHTWVYVEPDGSLRSVREGGTSPGNLLHDSWQDIWPPG